MFVYSVGFFSFILCQDIHVHSLVSPLFAKKGYQMNYNMGYRMRQTREKCTNFEESGCDDKLIMAIVVRGEKKLF